MYELSRSSKKYACPGCGQKTYTPYVYTQSGNLVSVDKFGRCDRENNCGYHVHPGSDKQHTADPGPARKLPEPKLIKPDKGYYQSVLANFTSEFHGFCRQKLGITNDIFAEWLCGTDGQRTVFASHDGADILNMKYMQYGKNCKRDKKRPPHYMGKHYLLQKGILHRADTEKVDDWQLYYRFDNCLYGQHLFDKERDTMLVESEKTAIIGSFFFPDYNWLATGGAAGKKFGHFEFLYGYQKRLLYLVDNDKAGQQSKISQWLQKLKETSKATIYESVNLFPKRPDGWDLADEVIEKGLSEEVFHMAIEKALQKQDGGQQQEPEAKKRQGRGVFFSDSGIIIEGARGEYPVTDYNIRIQYKIHNQDTEETQWILGIKKEGKEEQSVVIENRDFCSAKRFHEYLIQHDYIWMGTDNDLKKVQLELIQRSKTAVKIPTLGFDQGSEVFFFSNVAFNGKMLRPNEFGIVEHGEKCYFMPFSDEEKRGRAFKNARRFVFRERSDITFNEWHQLFTEAFEIEGFLPSLFYISTVFADVVTNDQKFFPLMYLRGPAQSGKSSIARAITSMFGHEQDEISLKSPNTVKSLQRLLAQMSNAVLWLDEYHNDLRPDVQGMLQSVYDRAGYEKAAMTMGNETVSNVIKSTLLLTSNYTPQDGIFFSRCILVQVDNKERSQTQKEAFEKLRHHQQHNLSCVTTELLQHRPLVTNRFRATQRMMFKRLRQLLPDTNSVKDRTLNNMASIMAPGYILAQAGKIKIMELPGSSMLDTMMNIAVHYIKAQVEVTQQKSDLMIWFEFMQNFHDNGRLRNNYDYKFNGKGQISLRVQRVHPNFAKEYYQVYHKSPVDRMEIIELMKAHPAFISINSSCRFKNWDDGSGGGKSSVTSAVVMDWEILRKTFLLNLDGEPKRDDEHPEDKISENIF